MLNVFVQICIPKKDVYLLINKYRMFNDVSNRKFSRVLKQSKIMYTKTTGSGLLAFLLIWVTFSPALGQSVVEEGAKPVEVVSGFQFTEGPVWHPGGYLLFSDIPANTIFKWTPGTEQAIEFLNPSGHSNGIVLDLEGNLLLAQHDGKISRVNNDKTMEVVVSEFEGNRLNSPNDLTIRSDGTIYFTDPPYGVSEEDKELDVNGVYKLSPDGVLSLIFQDLGRPNGVVLSPDEKTLYVNNSSDGRILAFEVTTDGNVSLPDEFASVGEAAQSGAADGMTVDKQGRLYCTGPGGIYVFDESGEQIQKIDMPVRASNMGWGGPDHQTLYITTPNSIYRLKMNTAGVN